MQPRSDLPRNDRGALSVRDRRFSWGERTYVMGIVNASPDSFSGDGRQDVASAIVFALQQSDLGADIIDVGGESTRPGHTPIDADTECRRLLPVIAGLRSRRPEAIISADTFKPAVFRAALDAGADMLNSIWGVDDALLEVAAQRSAPVILMHNKAVPVYERDVVDEVLSYLEGAGRRAVAAGIRAGNVILDPGIGFGKMPEHNVAILGALPRIVALGFPTLLGVSRKSTIGKLTGQPVDRRTYGTAAAVALGIAAGIDIIRVHDTAEMRDVAAVCDAVVRGWRPESWNERLP